MTASTFNAVTYANKLKKAKDIQTLADIQAEEMGDLINNNLATKDDLKILKIELQAFFVKTIIAAVGFLAVFFGVLQTVFHFIRLS